MEEEVYLFILYGINIIYPSIYMLPKTGTKKG